MQRARQRKIAALLARLGPEERAGVQMPFNTRTRAQVLRREARLRK